MKNIKLDEEEQDLLESVERGEWKSVENLQDEIERHQRYAKNTLKKDRRVNIRISSKDLEEIQTLAIEDGIPYQTLMSSVLHRFINGRLTQPQPTSRTKASSGRIKSRH